MLVLKLGIVEEGSGRKGVDKDEGRFAGDVGGRDQVGGVDAAEMGDRDAGVFACHLWGR